MALVVEVREDELAVRPLGSRANYYTARSREVIGHWRRVGTPRHRGRVEPACEQLEVAL